MNTLLFVAIIVSSLTNGILVMCFVPNGENVDLLLSPKSEPYSIQEDSEHNDRSVYDRGVEKPKSAIAQEISHLARMSEPTNPRNDNNDEQNYMDESEQSSLSDDESYNTNYIPNNENLLERLNNLRNDIIEEEDIAVKSALLLKLLEESSGASLPILYVEGDTNPNDPEDEDDSDVLLNKRSGRYYRRYPWKRRSRSKYNPENRYECVPSREDVYKLLLGLHENRKGNHRKVVTFCNRDRQARQIFTHIRFLG